jgi:hypothetical protein
LRIAYFGIAYFGIAYFGIAYFEIAYFGIAYFGFASFGIASFGAKESNCLLCGRLASFEIIFVLIKSQLPMARVLCSTFWEGHT